MIGFWIFYKFIGLCIGVKLLFLWGRRMWIFLFYYVDVIILFFFVKYVIFVIKVGDIRVKMI